jgi:hypothetical protein
MGARQAPIMSQKTSWLTSSDAWTLGMASTLPPSVNLGVCYGESAFAPYVGFGVLMTSKLGTNEILIMRYIVALIQ